MMAITAQALIFCHSICVARQTINILYHHDHQTMNMQTLSNRYFVMRHGQSEANVAGIIVSNPAVGCASYGLTETGKQQAAKSISQSLQLEDTIRIYSSDFLRAKETAEIVHKLLHGKHPLHFTPQLRERFFGDLNGLGDNNYQKVWTLDQTDPNHHQYGVESANQVVTRTKGLIDELESQFENETILLVAHGDVLQLLQTWFQGVCASQHRQLPHLDTAEIRHLKPI
tara:strand:+ start:1231 stop:1914 length:684 start_codon:yes stop_codon:yes gene_type:complete